MSRPYLPEWSVDTLHVSGRRTVDDLGREWGVEDGTDKGWINPPATRPNRKDRPVGHGSFRAAAYRSFRQFSLGGFVACPTPQLRERTEVELASLCSDPGALYEFRRRTDSYDHTAMVELDDDPLIEMVTVYTLRWNFTWAAPDPRKHDHYWQEPVCTAPQTHTTGLNFAPTGLDFSSGLDFGITTIDSTIAQVGNYGTAPAYPLLRLQGPLSAPAVVHRESGRAIRYASDIAAGEVVTVNCDDFPARGCASHAAISTARGNVSSLLVREGRDWPVVDPQTAATFTLRSGGDLSATLTVSLRSAFW